MENGKIQPKKIIVVKSPSSLSESVAFQSELESIGIKYFSAFGDTNTTRMYEAELKLLTTYFVISVTDSTFVRIKNEIAEADPRKPITVEEFRKKHVSLYANDIFGL